MQTSKMISRLFESWLPHEEDMPWTSGTQPKVISSGQDFWALRCIVMKCYEMKPAERSEGVFFLPKCAERIDVRERLP